MSESTTDNFTTALEHALTQPTLIEALTSICVWESERAIRQVATQPGSGSDGAGWDTCFNYVISAVLSRYAL